MPGWELAYQPSRSPWMCSKRRPPITVTGDFPVRHGQTTGSLSTGPPDPGTFSCPSGQALYLVGEVKYEGITVSDESGNSLGATPDPASADVGTPPNGGILITPKGG